MKASGGPDPLYVAARRVLLDALEALEQQLDALVLVGAQAVYLHTGEGELAVAPYTTDGDIAIDPNALQSEPLLEASLKAGGFELKDGAVGIWSSSVDVEGTDRVVNIDLLVPDSLGGGGRRAARIPPHGRLVARKVKGLEAALVDQEFHEIRSFEAGDERRFKLNVAGPSALIVAKVHKIMDRSDDTDRVSDKDALDVLRILQAVQTDDLAKRLSLLLENGLSSEVTNAAISSMQSLFGATSAVGTRMAVRAAGVLESRETVAASLVALANDLLQAVSTEE